MGDIARKLILWHGHLELTLVINTTLNRILYGAFNLCVKSTSTDKYCTNRNAVIFSTVYIATQLSRLRSLHQKIRHIQQMKFMVLWEIT